jgi:hypothetical protein
MVDSTTLGTPSGNAAATSKRQVGAHAAAQRQQAVDAAFPCSQGGPPLAAGHQRHRGVLVAAVRARAAAWCRGRGHRVVGECPP